MENCKISQNIIHRVYVKKHIVPIVLVIFTLVFCQTTFSDIISVTPDSLFVDVQSAGTATVKILSDQKSPLINILVATRSNKESVATVAPIGGLTNSNGQISFTIAGISNGTATITFNTNTLSKSLPVSVVSNIAPCAIASSSGGGDDEFGPEMMNDGIEKDACSYHWIRTRKQAAQKKSGWIRLDSDENTWITDNEFIEEIGDVEYSFTESITTKAIRVKKISHSTECKGQQSNPVVFEWKVYGSPTCN